MNESKHTPGRWEAGLMADKIGDWYEISGPKLGRSSTVADTQNRDPTIGPDEDRANARLIAAAPTMREYLEKRASLGDMEAMSILDDIDGHDVGRGQP